MALPFQIRIPFVEMLGIELERFDPGESEITLVLHADLTNSWSVAHGGVSMTMLDVAMALAARSPSVAGGPVKPGVVTVEMKTSFLRPATGRLVARGKLLHRTASMAFCEASLLDAEDALTAHATGTFKYLRGLPVGGRRIERLHASD